MTASDFVVGYVSARLFSSKFAKSAAVITAAAMAFGLVSLYKKLSFMYGGSLEAALRQVEEHARVQLGCKDVSDLHAEFFNWRISETTGSRGLYKREYTFNVSYSCSGVATAKRVEISEELGQIRLQRVQAVR